MSKNGDENLDVSEEDEGVFRLTDMDTKEVSIVDRAANKRKFLVIKRDEGADEMAAETQDVLDETQDIETPTEDIVTKSAISLCIEQASEKAYDLIKAIKDAPVAEKDVGLPESVLKNLGQMQSMLRGVSSGQDMVAILSPVEIDEPISKAVKKKAEKQLRETARRLDKIAKNLETAEIIDAGQVEKIDGASDLLGALVIDHCPEGVAKIDASSLTDAERTTVLSEVEKALDDLGALRLALVTKSGADDVEGSEAVAGVVTKSAEALETAGFAIVKDETGAQQIISSVRVLAKAIGDESKDVLSPVVEHLTALAKAASQYRVRTNWDKPEGDPAKYIVQEVFEPEPPKQIATFPSRMAAENECFKLKVSAVMKIAKMCEVHEGGKGYQAKDPKTGKVYYDGPDKKAAQAMADRMNMKGGAKKADDTAEENAVATETKTTDTEKVGAPMKSTRLTRLKTAVSLLKDALGDLKANKVSMEKFKKVGAELMAIINELSTAKMVNAQRGIEDKRSANVGEPNNGAGVQPDTEVVAGVEAIAGEGASALTETLKSLNDRLEGLEKDKFLQSEEIKKRDRLLSDLQAENARLKRTRRSSSAIPDEKPVKTAKASDGGDFHWPADMANWDGE